MSEFAPNRVLAAPLLREHNKPFKQIPWTNDPPPDESPTCEVLFIDFHHWGGVSLIASVEDDQTYSFRVLGYDSKPVGDTRNGDVITIHTLPGGQTMIAVQHTPTEHD